MISIQSIFGMMKSKRSTGCDLGASCLKVVKLDKAEKKVKLVSKGIAKIPSLLSANERALSIENFLRENDLIPEGQIRVNIEDSSLRIRRMDLPKMPDRDLKTAIRWNFREYVDGSIENYITNHLPVKGVMEEGKLSISAFCVSRESVEDRQALMKTAGVRVSVVEPNATALMAAFNYNYRSANKYYVLLDLGDSVSNFIVIGNGSLMFSRPLSNLSGKDLVDMVAQNLALMQEGADEALKKYLVDVSKNELIEDERNKKISDSISTFISQLVVDIQRSVDAFCLMYKKDRVDKMFLCGGGICLPDIVKRLSSGLGIDVDLFNPFNNIAGAEEISKSNTAPLYAVALGLALPWE